MHNPPGKIPVRLLAAALVAWAALLFAPPSSGASLSIAYTGPLKGELEPCGCTIDSDFGGIRRLATILDTLRDKDQDLVLIGTGGLLGTTQPAHQVTNDFILRGIATLNYDAIGLRWDDLIYGLDALRKTPLPWVASNWRATQADKLVNEMRIIDRAAQRVVFLQWLPSEESPHQNQPVNQQRVHNDVKQLERQLSELKQQSIFTIVGGIDDAQVLQRLPAGLIDVLLLNSSNEQYGPPERVDQTLVLRPGSRGQHLGHLKIETNSVGGLEVVSHNVITLDESIPDAKRLEDWYKLYEASLLDDYQTRERLAKENQTKGIFVGDGICGICHAKQKAQWQRTDHAHAYQSLLDVSKQFDANCIGCHVVGFGKPGGFYSALAKPDLRNVGCEACHGEAKLHQLHGGTKPLSPVTRKVCETCHNAQHSPGFDPVKFRERIKH